MLSSHTGQIFAPDSRWAKKPNSQVHQKAVYSVYAEVMDNGPGGLSLVKSESWSCGFPFGYSEALYVCFLVCY